MVYYLDPAMRAKQAEDARRNGGIMKLSARTPSIGEQAKNMLIDQGKNLAINKGAEWGLEQLGVAPEAAPGYIGAVKGLYTGGKILASDANPDQKMKGLTTLGQDTGANVATGGIYGLGKFAADKLTGGQASKLQSKYNDTMDSKIGMVLDPTGFLGRGALKKGLSMFGSGKGEDQMRRDAVRKMLKEGGFLGEGDDWNLENPDGTSFDIGKDGGARLENGRGYMDVDTTKQGASIGAMNPLAYIITGGDEKLATNFAGYFTNTVTQGDGANNPVIANANALDKYKKAGLDTPQKAHAAIDELVKSGKLAADKAQAFHGGINTVFGQVNPTAGTVSSGVKQSHQSASRRGNRRRQFEYQLPNVQPQVLAPSSTTPFGVDFAQSLASIYRSNQGL